ncbi:MAG: prepilin-type N-terminal cleavage/methylation domain-containing protein [Planctomycetota bacterium]
MRFTRRGFSMLEVAVSSVLVGVTLASALNATGSAFRAHALARDIERRAVLSEALLCEIVSLAYEDPGGTSSTLGRDDAETGRATFDDVDDFDGYSEMGAALFGVDDLSAADRAAGHWSDGWSWSAAVDWAGAGTAGRSTVETGLKRVRLTLRSPDGAVTVHTAFRAAGSVADVRMPEAGGVANVLAVRVLGARTPDAAAEVVALRNATPEGAQ